MKEGKYFNSFLNKLSKKDYIRQDLDDKKYELRFRTRQYLLDGNKVLIVNGLKEDQIKDNLELIENHSFYSELHQITDRPLNGQRLERTDPTKEQEEEIRDLAEEIGVPQEILEFGGFVQTAYYDWPSGSRFIGVMGDIFPDLDSVHPVDRMSTKAALAQEYYGHYKVGKSLFRKASPYDEARANCLAWRDAPNLSHDDREDLKDACEFYLKKMKGVIVWESMEDTLMVPERELWELLKGLGLETD